MTEEKDLGLEEMNMCCSVSHWAIGVAFMGNRVPELIFTELECFLKWIALAHALMHSAWSISKPLLKGIVILHILPR